jgi:glycosyltransferase involved in cell wall biosynthesis
LYKRNINLIKIPNINDDNIPLISLVYRLKNNFNKADILFFPRYLDGYLYLIFKRFLSDKKKTIYNIENPVPHSYWSKLIESEQRYLVNNCDYIYSVSKYVANSVRNYYGINSKVIYPGVDTKIFKPLNGEKKKKKIKVLFIGSLQERKRPQKVLEAAKEFPDSHFTLIGQGPLKPVLKRMKETKNLTNVEIINNLPLNELVSQMQVADIFLFPSILEGFPKVVIESAACGLPAIIYDNYESETVIDKKTGFIVKNHDEMFDRLGNLVNNDSMRIELGKNAIDYAKKFDWDIITKQWENEFENILQENE